MTSSFGAAPDPLAPDALPTSIWETPIGTLRVCAHASDEFILSLDLDSGLGVLFRLNRYVEEFLRVARHPGGNVVLAVGEPGLVVGYLLVERPVPVAWQRRVARNRWSACPAVLELGALEVSRNYRRLAVAEHLLQALVDDPLYQDKIIIATIMRRYWDLAGAHLDPWQYRAALVALLDRFGFQVYPSDDPRVTPEPTDALLARMGPETAPEHIEQFHRLRLLSTPSPS